MPPAHRRARDHHRDRGWQAPAAVAAQRGGPGAGNPERDRKKRGQIYFLACTTATGGITGGALGTVGTAVASAAIGGAVGSAVSQERKGDKKEKGTDLFLCLLTRKWICPGFAVTFSSEDRDTFERVVANVFAPLIAAGFVHISTQLNSSAALGGFLETFLVSDSRKRRLRIALVRAGVREAVVVHVEKTDGGTFLVNTFLKQQGVSDSLLRQCELSSYQGSLSARLEGCLEFVRTMLEKHLVSVLNGHSWPDVPVDWGDYR